MININLTYHCQGLKVKGQPWNLSIEKQLFSDEHICNPCGGFTMEDIWDSILSEADKTFVRLDFFPPLPTCEVKAPVLSVI